MTEHDGMSSRSALSALKANWWIVLLALAASLAVAGWFVKDASASHAAEAEVTVRTAIATRESILLPEQAVGIACEESFAETVAARTAIEVHEYLDGARCFATGASQQHIHLEFTSKDSSVAQEVADAMADALIEEAQGTVSAEVDRTEEQIALTQDMIELTSDLDPLALSTNPDRGQYEIDKRLYELNLKLVGYEDTIDTLESAYVRTGPIVVSTDTVADQVTKPLAGAALAGLAIGVVLAWLRESLRSRGA